MSTRLAAALVVIALARPAAADEAPLARPHLHATRLARPPVIDGRIDDPAWRLVPASDAYTQKFPREGERPTEKTLLRVAYDDDAVYVAIECQQRLAPIVRRLTRRDRMVEADWVAVAFDTRRDGRTAFVFNVNAAGVLSDMIRFDDTDMSFDWDENWDAQTALTAGGWSAELRIPLRVLRFATLPVQSWGFQSRRYVSQRQETDEWAFIPRSAAGEVSQYGQLDDLRGLRPGRGVELSPFVWSRVRRRDAEESHLARGTDLAAAAGLDLKWHPSQELTVDAAFLPDFGQVEADQVVLNLTNFETEFPEKRRFFLEGIDTFTTPEIKLLYTRRIGRAAPPPVLRDGEQLVDQPGPATIYGAGKLTGRVGRWEIGALSAITARNQVEVQAPDGTRSARVADPLSFFNVLRIKRAVGDNGHIGLLATSVVRSDAQGPQLVEPTAGPQTLCADGRQVTPGQRCSNDAHVGGVDWRWRSPTGDYATNGQLVGSLLERGPPRAIPDGTVIDPGDLGSAVRMVVHKDGGKNWLWYAWVARDSRKLTVDDAGILDRANQYGTGGQLTLRSLQPHAHTLESALKLELIALNNLDGLATQRTAQLLAQVRFANFWGVSVGAGGSRPHFDDREVGDGAALERVGNVGGSLSLESDPRARLFLRLDSGVERVQNGGHTLRAELSLQLRTLPQLDLELVPQAFYTDGEIRYAATADGGTYLFGTLLARSLGLTTRATYTFAPQLTLQAYAQLFLSARHYRDFAAFAPSAAGPHPVIHLGDLQAGAGAPSTNPDTQDVALNANVVLRWEFRTGSLLYLVYTRAQAPTLTLRPGEVGKLDLRSVRRAPAADVILLKLVYWWG